MTKLIKISALFCIAILAGCQDSVFIPDPLDPRLVKYTEDGNNASAALINGDIWSTDDYYNYDYNFYESDIDVVSYDDADSLIITFYGLLDEREDLLLHFSLKDFGIDEARELVKLDEQKIQLDGAQNTAIMESLLFDETYAGGVGQIYFKSVKRADVSVSLLEEGSVIISGTFSFTIPGENIEVTYGRFDYEVSFVNNY